jgi:hypothetical protein
MKEKKLKYAIVQFDDKIDFVNVERIDLILENQDTEFINLRDFFDKKEVNRNEHI